MSRKRRDILSAALRLFAERGFSATSTTLLAKEAGVAEGTIFRHFSGKEEIFNELLADLFIRIKGDIEAEIQKSPDCNGLDEIMLAVQVFLTFVRGHTHEFTLFFSDAPVWYSDKDSATYQRVHAVYEYITSFLAGNIKRGKKDHSIRADVEFQAASVVMGCAVIGMARSIHFGLIENSDAYVGSLLKYFRLSLQNKNE